MSTDEASAGPSPLEFEADPSTKMKKGAHKPVFAHLFSAKPKKVKATKHIHLFVNPYAGSKSGRKIGEQAIALLEAAGKSVKAYHSAYSGHLIEMAQGLELKANDLVAVVGGDGSLKNISGSLIGFFSRHHKTVFTHHDSFFHAHFISEDREVLGHIDETDFNSSKVTLKVSK